jgi:hypothetical protein
MDLRAHERKIQMSSTPARQRGHLSLVQTSPRPITPHPTSRQATPAAVPALYAILAGRIPARECDRIRGGRGTGGPCAICGKRLEPFDIEFAMEFTVGAGAGIYHVHVPCCMAWEQELP